MQKILLGGALLAAVAALGAVNSAEAQDAPYCREYQQKVTIGGVVRQTYGTACMQPDGSWQKLDAPQASDQDAAAYDVAEDFQVAQYQQPVVVRNVVYEQPAYYYQQPVEYYGYRPSVGLSFGFNGWNGRGGWNHGHGGGRGGHGGEWHGGRH